MLETCPKTLDFLLDCCLQHQNEADNKIRAPSGNDRDPQSSARTFRPITPQWKSRKGEAMCYISTDLEDGHAHYEIIHEVTEQNEGLRASECSECELLTEHLGEHMHENDVISIGTVDQVEHKPVITHADALIIAPLLTVAIDQNKATIQRLRQHGHTANAFVEENERLENLRDRVRSIGTDGLYAPPF